MLRRAALVAAALLVPAVAGTTTAQAAKSPVVKRITPKHVSVGETLTIHGRHFRRGLNKNTVAFKRSGAKAVFVQAEKGTAKLLKVKLPKRLENVLAVKNGTPIPTRLQIRVLSTKFGKRYTSKRLSPIVGAQKPPAPPKPPTADPDADCDGDGTKNGVDTDDDNDMLSDAQEKSLKLDGCHVDSDRDGVEDGYEHQSARDLNDDEHQDANTYLPYPEKRPYPNALDKTDADTDHDGDDLTLLEEYKLWKYTIAQGSARTLSALTYSAGEKFSVSVRGGDGRRVPTLAANAYDKQTQFLDWATATGYRFVSLSDPATPNHWVREAPQDIRDFDRDGTVEVGPGDESTYFDNGDDRLDDSERDEDADGLSNWAETRGCLGDEIGQKYWSDLYTKERRYSLTYRGTRLDDADTDGDGVRDGADDQDNDDLPNIMECSRSLAADHITNDLDDNAPYPGLPAEGWVNPFNPCLPHEFSRTCKRIVTIGNGWAPFDTKAADIYFIWN